MRRSCSSNVQCGAVAQAAHNDAFQANKSVQGRMFEGQTPDKAVTTAYNPTAMLY